MDPRVLRAAANNARWCDLVCRSHGLPTATSEELWVARRGSPPFYPDAVTLAPGLTADAVLGAIDPGPGSSVKDSFADLELGPHGFEVLFDAQWLFRHPGGPPQRPRLDWHVVATPEDFGRWVAAADLQGILRPALLDDPTVHVLLARRDEAGAAGAVANVTDGVVGVSNVFAAGIGADAVWSDLPAAVGQVAGDLPLVGYEWGDALGSALASGFATIGPLRVWAKPPA